MLRAQTEPYTEIAEYFLFDTYSSKGQGGTGTAFDWTLLENFDAGLPVFLAGGTESE